MTDPVKPALNFGKRSAEPEKLPEKNPADSVVGELEGAKDDKELDSEKLGGDDGKTDTALAPAEDVIVESEDERVTYSSHPLANFQMGPYVFTKGILKLDAKDAARFDKLLADPNLPPMERSKVKKVDTDIVNSLILKDQKSRSVTGIDSTANTLPGLTPEQQA